MLIALGVIVAIVVIAGFLGVQSRKQAQALLFRQSELAQADAMTGPQFERYFADLLRLRGHHGVRVVGGAGDGGIDILGTAPDGRAIAYQCKRQVANVSVQVVRQLIGSVAFEHQGRIPCLVTTAILTKPAADLARQSGVHIVDRPMLGTLMTEARLRLSVAAGSNSPASSLVPTWPGKSGAGAKAARALMATVSGVFLLAGFLLHVLDSVAASPPRSRSRRRSPARRRYSGTGRRRRRR